ncbi:MAG TPA: M42 family metallopeptidase [Thermomicrobiaceae bacterium]|nr:M42 family metallopeptidase [Thermomicrobiaceae bacterium]
MDFNFDLFKKIVEAPGIPGREAQLRQIVIEEMRPLVDDLRVDAIGNVIGTKKGSGGPRVMLAAHMDEIGFMVRFIDDNGFIRLQNVGGFDARNLPAQRVWVHTRDGQKLPGALQLASKPIHTLSPEEIKPPKLADLFVDIGLSGEEAKQQVDIGDMVTLMRPVERVGGNVMGKALDDRASVFIMLETLRAVGQHGAEIVAVATTEEEVGLRGAGPAAYSVQPDVGIALDVTIAGDAPGMPAEDRVSKLGDGVAIKIFDSSHIPNYKLVRFVREVAEKHNIPHQLEVLPRGGTDAGAMERSRAGVPVITISLPTRYLHTVNETANVQDILSEIQLLARLLEEIHQGDFSLAS